MRLCSVIGLVTALLAGTANAGCMDTDNGFWLNASSQAVYDQLLGIMACPADADKQTGQQVDAVACNYFVAKGLSVVYGVGDFTPDNNGGQWLLANQIADFVHSHPDLWLDLGPASSQQVLADAAAGAANRRPTIAVKKGDPHGHVAIILGGDLKVSGNWHLNVPNSAAFKLDDVSQAYVFCRLSFAFHDASDVEIFSRDPAR